MGISINIIFAVIVIAIAGMVLLGLYRSKQKAREQVHAGKGIPTSRNEQESETETLRQQVREEEDPAA